MDDDEKFDICDPLFENFGGQDSTINACLIFIKQIASGFRFRYQSEIDKKSYSLLKTDKNESPIVQVVSSVDNAFITLELVTENYEYHFNEIYEVSKESNIVPMNAEVIRYSLGKSGTYEIKLDNLGIRKMKNREALTKIKKIYPKKSDSDAKAFFNKEKDVVVLKVTLYQNSNPVCCLYSSSIKSQIARDNKSIKIKHFSPKVVADSGEQLIVVLEKKITSDDIEGFLVIDGKKNILHLAETDMQTFIFNLPDVTTSSPIDAKFHMKCDNNEDFKLIKFLPQIIETRKRKSMNNQQYLLPLKKCNVNDSLETSVQKLYPESGNFDQIETDNANPMNFETIQILFPDRRILEDEFSVDSGIHSSSPLDFNLSCVDMNSEEMEDEIIEIEGLRIKSNRHSQQTPCIILPSKERSVNSQLDINKTTAASKKILTEVARIGHDFAFGSEKSDLFERIVNQLPVVFTLQDEYGDTPLNNAILKGNVAQAYEILRIVKEHCSWALDLMNTSGHTALILAPACKVPAEFVKSLLLVGCRLDMWDDTGKSSIIHAIEYQNIEALYVLLEYVQQTKMTYLLSRFCTSYYTPLQIAIMSSFKAGIEMLLELRDYNGHYLVNVNEIGLGSEETALHTAVSHSCDVEILKMLLKRSDILVNKLNMCKETALDIAIKMKSTPIIDVLKSFEAIAQSSNHIEADNIEESSDDEDLDEIMMNSSEPILSPEMDREYDSVPSVNAITCSMEDLSLKGEIKVKMIDILINSIGPSLTISELREIVKPNFRSIFNKYGNTYEHNKKDVSQLLDRFNCLPDSVGVLLQTLENIGRQDLKHKILTNFIH